MALLLLLRIALVTAMPLVPERERRREAEVEGRGYDGRVEGTGPELEGAGCCWAKPCGIKRELNFCGLL